MHPGPGGSALAPCPGRAPGAAHQQRAGPLHARALSPPARLTARPPLLLLLPGRERKDLYTDNWDGSEYKGSSFNVLTVLAVVSVLTPLLGLAFAYWSFGVYWG